MGTVRKRKLPSGLIRWQASYVDGAGKRRAKLFDRKSDGEAWLVEIQHDVKRGLHTPDSLSPTVKAAAALWIKRCDEKRLEATTIQSYQRADAFHKIGRLKSKAGYRSIPCPPIVINALREWKLVCPKGALGLVFPTGNGQVESHSNIAQRGLNPILMASGMTVREPALDENGQPTINSGGDPVTRDAPRYGMHSLRHACASLWIENGMNPKRIQTLMGHSTIQMTFDTYGHLFKDAEADQKAAEDIQVRLLGS